MVTLDEIMEESEDFPIAWTTQCTMDYKVTLSRDEIEKILQETTVQESEYYIENDKYQQQAQKTLNDLGEGEFKKAELSSEQLTTIEKLVEGYVPRKVWKYEIGGSPAISAIAAYSFLNGTPESSKVRFIGNLVGTVDNFLGSAPMYGPLFEDAISNSEVKNYRPRTLSLEEESGDFKVMLPFSEGRQLVDLKKYQFLVQTGLTGREYEGIFLGLGGLNKAKNPTEYTNLIAQVQALFGKRSDFYIGTNSFSNFPPGLIIKDVEVLQEGDIISMNDSELQQIYSVLGKKIENKNLSQMLSELHELMKKNGIKANRNQIMMCHSKNGAIAYVPDEGYNDAVAEALQISINGASYSYQKDHYPSQTNVKSFQNKHTTSQSKKGFEEDFGQPSNLSKNLCYAIAPAVKNPDGTTTGLGATLDGIFSVYVSHIVRHMKTALK